VIGSVLAVIAVFLGRESGALLVGERTNRARIDKLRDIITADSAVERVGDLLTMQLGPEQVLLNVDIQFRRNLDLQQLESAIDRIEARIQKEQPSVQRIFIEAESFKTTDKSAEKAA
jgi:divalent metal cation (Fe/Co/Zn/Cd) transporter